MAATIGAAQVPGAWDQPTAALADKVAAMLGPGQARLTLRNLSTISAQEIPTIRKLLEEDLTQRGIGSAGDESANAIRVTLSENARQRLWVAEVIEGNVTQVAMVEAGSTLGQRAPAAGGLSLRKQTLLTTHEPVLAALEMANSLVLLEPEQVVLYTRTPDGWREWKRVSIGQKQPLPRDARGKVNPDPDGTAFHAWLAGAQCTGSVSAGDWTVSCHPSDDPWPVVSAQNANRAPGLSAFYNPARNYFTGVVTPNLGVDLPPFYCAALGSRALRVPLPTGGRHRRQSADARERRTQTNRRHSRLGQRFRCARLRLRHGMRRSLHPAPAKPPATACARMNCPRSRPFRRAAPRRWTER